MTRNNVHEYIFAESQRVYPHGEVFSFDLDRDEIAVLEKLIVMWKGSQRELMPMGKLLAQNQNDSFRIHQVGWGKTPDHLDNIAIQSLPVG